MYQMRSIKTESKKEHYIQFAFLSGEFSVWFFCLFVLCGFFLVIGIQQYIKISHKITNILYFYIYIYIINNININYK